MLLLSTWGSEKRKKGVSQKNKIDDDSNRSDSENYREQDRPRGQLFLERKLISSLCDI